jgi:hypothetical protein
VASLERDVNELSRKSDIDKNEQHSDSGSESDQVGKARLLDGRAARIEIEGEEKFSTGLKHRSLVHSEGPPVNTNDGFLRGRGRINDSNASEEGLDELVRGPIESRARPPPAAKPQAKKLYFVKETYWRYVMSVKVKLKNMELWITDYNNEPEKKAQILQLKFMSDLFYDSDQFGKEIRCSKQPLKQPTGFALPYHQQESEALPRPAGSAQERNAEALQAEVEDDLDEANLEELKLLNEAQTDIQEREEYHPIRKVLESRDHT